MTSKGRLLIAASLLAPSLTAGAALAEPGAAEAAADASVSEVVVMAQRLDAARATIQPQTGASTYAISAQVNLSVSHRFEHLPAGPFELRFDIVNAFDDKYEIRNGAGVGVGAPQFGPRQGFFFGVRKEI